MCLTFVVVLLFFSSCLFCLPALASQKGNDKSKRTRHPDGKAKLETPVAECPVPFFGYVCMIAVGRSSEAAERKVKAVAKPLNDAETEAHGVELFLVIYVKKLKPQPNMEGTGHPSLGATSWQHKKGEPRVPISGFCVDLVDRQLPDSSLSTRSRVQCHRCKAVKRLFVW